MALENFTTYDETDESADLTITANNISISSMSRTADSHVSFDKGVDHFAGDFEFIEEVLVAAATENDAQINFCSVANSQESSHDIDLASGSVQFAEVFNTSGTVPTFFVIEIDAGTFSNGSGVAAVEATQYYCEFERDEGIGSFGDLELRVYDDVGRTSLVGTSTVTLNTAKRNFRYVYGMQSKNEGSGDWTGNLDNLDLQEAFEARPPLQQMPRHAPVRASFY